MKKLLLRIVKNEKINFSSEEVMDKIIYHSQNDMRRLIHTLQDIYNAFGSKLINSKSINLYIELSKEKDVDVDLFKSTKKILLKYRSIDECLKFYETEKVLLPLMIHENYIKLADNLLTSKDKKIKIINDISESLSRGDITENYIYGDQSWDMQEIHGFHTCVKTSFSMSSNINKNIDTSYIPMNFTSDLNKTSIKKINKKNINNANKCFQNMNIFDYIYTNKLIKKLIDNNEIEDCVKIFNNYNIKLEHIESLLKIDKITSTKNNLASKQKKEFLKYLQ